MFASIWVNLHCAWATSRAQSVSPESTCMTRSWKATRTRRWQNDTRKTQFGSVVQPATARRQQRQRRATLIELDDSHVVVSRSVSLCVVRRWQLVCLAWRGGNTSKTFPSIVHRADHHRDVTCVRSATWLIVSVRWSTMSAWDIITCRLHHQAQPP